MTDWRPCVKCLLAGFEGHYLHLCSAKKSISVTAAIWMKCKCEHLRRWCGICIYKSVCVCVREWMYLSNEGLCCAGAHEQHRTPQCVPVAMQLFHPHGAEHSSDHHVNIGFHLLERHIHPLLRCLVQEVLYAPDIWTSTDNIIQTTFIFWPVTMLLKGKERTFVWLSWIYTHAYRTFIFTDAIVEMQY